MGSGDTRWREMLANLDGAGYTGWITIDPMELADRQGRRHRGWRT